MRTRIALAGALLGTAVVLGPFAGTGHGAAPTVVRCPSPESAEVCDLLDEAAALLGPLQTVLAPAGADLGVVNLPTLAARPEGVAASVVLDQVTSVRDQLGDLPEPLRSTPGVVQLAEVLDDLVGTLTAPADDQVAPASPERPTPASPTPGPAGPTTSFGGTASSSGTTATPVDSPAIPDVPVGDSLTLAPLALPDFGFDQDFEIPAAATELAAAAPVVDEAELAFQAAADRLQEGSSGPEVLVTVAAVVLLLGTAVALDVRKRAPATDR